MGLREEWQPAFRNKTLEDLASQAYRIEFVINIVLEEILAIAWQEHRDRPGSRWLTLVGLASATCFR